MNIEDHKLLLENNFKAYVNAFSLTIENRVNKKFFYADKNGREYFGHMNKIDSLIKVLEVDDKLENDGNTEYKISETNISYLKKILILIEKHQVKAYLIRSPKHVLYPGRLNEKIFQTIIRTQFSNITFLDFSDFPLTNEEFADFEHMNYKGSEKFTRWFSGMLENGLLNSLAHQDFINSEMTKIVESIEIP
jgi:hypothetical protein